MSDRRNEGAATGASTPGTLVLDTVVRQHAEEAAMLRHQRTALVRAPHIGLLMLGRHDERIAAHLDGLAVAGPAGIQHARAVQEEGIPGAATGEAFAVAVALLQAREAKQLDALVESAAERADMQRGLLSALGWVSADLLRGLMVEWLASSSSLERIGALAACAMHRVDPGPALASALSHADPSVRAAALRAAGQLGRVELLAAVCEAMGDTDVTIAYQAAWSACRLGEREASTRAMAAVALSDSAQADAGLALLMSALPAPKAHEFARQVSASAAAQGAPASQRRLVRTLGLLGETRFVPWLIERMDDPALARLAGESFCLITGADLAALQLERLEGPPPAEAPKDADVATRSQGAERKSVEAAGDDAALEGESDDEPIELDPDRDLPWPDAARVARWWQQQPLAKDASSQRCFMGREPGEAAWQHALRNGNQRQRAQAALHLAVHQPASRIFPVAAPAWRQRRWLASG